MGLFGISIKNTSDLPGVIQLVVRFVTVASLTFDAPKGASKMLRATGHARAW